ncbi:hypothetical protein [Bradyrhizobium vignae]|uniref:Uncharacterized protein n=1 Tax=Bradyrhizobium vignae TaxID=1549949 RepID=A0ABS4A6F1_9BRAD|nr:hypothetical protein [Bradyrhizobium vignae]MBP0115992.1 hypothetical protein [Bradyrhizobium vignae]
MGELDADGELDKLEGGGSSIIPVAKDAAQAAGDANLVAAAVGDSFVLEQRHGSESR